ncbi:MAG: hypothetical protein ED859_03815 [Desulfuromonadales bacterium]|nr:MAG: hypothetical protein ED859_03815 [Desulfuromonadales bacterium]
MPTTSPSVSISEPAVLIRINQMYSPMLSTEALYEATRGVWVIGERRNKVCYALAVANGIVREVYAVHSWHPAGTTPYATRPKHDVDYKGRWEFIGEVAPPAVREKYVDRSVAHYFSRGAANPIMYVNS